MKMRLLWTAPFLKLNWIILEKQNLPNYNHSSLLSLCPHREWRLDEGVASGSSVSPCGSGKPDRVTTSQLARCGAVTARPSSTQNLSLSHSLLVICSSGRMGVHSFLVSMSERLLWLPDTSFSLSLSPFLCFWSRSWFCLIQLVPVPLGKACKLSDSQRQSSNACILSRTSDSETLDGRTSIQCKNAFQRVKV